MKPYMAFSKDAGPQDGAILVIANTAREARKLAWGRCPNVDDWLDQAVLLIRDDSVLALSLKTDQPHVIDNPLGCDACGFWGAGLTNDNLCGNCNQPPGDTLVHCLKLGRQTTASS